MTPAIGPVRPQYTPPARWVFAGDLDGTTLATDKADRPYIFHALEQQGITFGFITGRPLTSAATLKLPRSADFLIADNGGEIYHRHRSGPNPFFDANTSISHPEDGAWDSLNAQSGFNKARVRNLALSFGRALGLSVTTFDSLDVHQSGDHKITLVLPMGNPALITVYRNALETGLRAQPDMQWELSEPYEDKTPQGVPAIFIDIATPLANKGDALAYEMHRHNWDPNHTIVAINGGNDLPLLENDGRYAIIIGDDPLVHREALRRMSPDKLYFSPTPGFGVLEGIQAIRARDADLQQVRTIAWA